MTTKKRLQIFFPPDFVKIIKNGQNLFILTQKEHDRFFRNKIPRPYSMGNEIEFRFLKYQELKEDFKEVIYKYVPEAKRQFYLAHLPESPMEILKNNGVGTH